MTFLCKVVHSIFPLTFSIFSLILFTIFCSCLTSYLGYTYFDSNPTSFVTMASNEDLESEVARFMKELQTANNEVDKLHHEAANLSDN